MEPHHCFFYNSPFPILFKHHGVGGILHGSAATVAGHEEGVWPTMQALLDENKVTICVTTPHTCISYTTQH